MWLEIRRAATKLITQSSRPLKAVNFDCGCRTICGSDASTDRPQPLALIPDSCLENRLLLLII